MLDLWHLSRLDLESIIDELGPAAHRAQFSVAGEVVSAVTNDRCAMAWADSFLAPWAVAQPGTGPAYAWLTHASEAGPLFDELPGLVHLSESRTVGPGDQIRSFTVAEEDGPWAVSVAAGAGEFRGLARGVAGLLNRRAAAQRVVAEAAAVEIGGTGVLLIGQAGVTERILLRLLQAGQFVSAGRALLDVADGSPTAWGPVSSVVISPAAAAGHPVLSKHLHAFEHFTTADDEKGLPGVVNRGLELTAAEFTAILDCGHKQETRIGLVAWLDPAGEGADAVVTELPPQERAARLHAVAAGEPGFPDVGTADEIVNRFATVPHVRLAGDLAGMASAVRSLAAQPSSDPRTWPRPELAGRLVCVMHHIRRDRGLTCASWRTRAVRAGEVHEFLVCRNEDVKRGGPLQDAWYIGFAALEACVLAVGDSVWFHGSLIGEIAGFDDTHLPNHMNVVLSSDSPRTGRELGALVGDALVIRPPSATGSQKEAQIAM